MKKILIAIIAAFTVVSCLDNGQYRATTPLDANFEYSESVYKEYFDTDSLYLYSVYGYVGWEYLAFLQVRDTVNKVFEGGALLSYQKSMVFNPEDEESLAKSDSLAFVEDRYRANAKADKYINTYMVHYTNPDASKMPVRDIEFVAKTVGTCQLGTCYVNNTRYVAYKVANTFEVGDRLTLKAIGYRGGEKTEEATINLADFSAQKDSIVSTWTAFDLSKLGAVEYVDFEMESTKEGIPAYFCLDHFGAVVTVEY